MKKYLYLFLFLVVLESSSAQWSQITSPYAGNLWAIKFFDQNIGYIGGNTAILKTIDGGDTWTSTPITNFMVNSFSFPSATVGYYGANNNIVAKTTDQGGSWINQNPNASPYSIESIDFLNTNVGYAVGGGGVIRKTINGGSTWTVQSSGLATNLEEVHFFDINTGICIGESGKIRRTINGGTTWSAVSSGTTANLYDMYFLDANTGFIAGGLGKILKTTNGGASWTILTTGTTQWLYSVCFQNSLVGYAGGAAGTIIKTTDGGSTWQSDVSGLTIQEVSDIIYINNRFIAVTLGGKILTIAGTAGINDNIIMDSVVTLFPNPTSDAFSICFPGHINLTATVDIIDLNGSLIRSEFMKENNQKFNVDDLINGTYVVEIKSNDVIVRKRLIINR
jgi:photosystem II stability/assembly factor-like uncharacterized protein